MFACLIMGKEPMNRAIVHISKIQHVWLFQGLPSEAQERIRRSALRIDLDDGQWLFREGDTADRFFLVDKGHIRLFRLSPAGNEKVIEILPSGGTFAEAVPFLPEQRYPVNAAALGPTSVIGFKNGVFRDILEESTSACFRLLADMSKRLHRRLSDIAALSLQDATYRTVGFLLSGTNNTQVQVAGEGIRLEVPKSVLASRLSITQETFSRILHNLSGAGLIEVRGATIYLRDVERLRALQHH